MTSHPLTAVPQARTLQPVVVKIDLSVPREDCDGCPGQALWRVMLSSGGELLLCGHHSRKAGLAGEDSHYAYQAEEANSA